jgi:hypothetical protein
MLCRFFHNSAAPDFALTHFKLRFDQGDAIRPIRDTLMHRREDVRQRDERNIDGGEFQKSGELARIQVPRILAFEHHDTRVLPQAPRELIVPDVYGKYACGSVLKQTISESARRSAYIEAVFTRRIDLELTQCGLKLQSAPAHVTLSFALDPNFGVTLYQLPWLFYSLFPHEHLSCEDQRLSTRAAFGETTLDK